MPISIALAQLNPVVGGISCNIAKLRDARAAAAAQGVDLIVTSELYLSAYPTEDLVLKPSFQDSLRAAVERLAQETSDGGPAILLGVPWRAQGKLYNAMLLLDGGHIAAKLFKHDLPNYGPFDEKRVFAAASLQPAILFRGVKLGVMICEDIWKPAVSAHLKEQGAEILIVSNGSPFEIGKTVTRHRLALDRVRETGLPMLYLNQLGGQDELVFDGGSFVLDAKGETVAQMPSWQESVSIIQFDNGHLSCQSRDVLQQERRRPPPFEGGVRGGVYESDSMYPILKGRKISPAPIEKLLPSDPMGDIYQALMLGLRDYVTKNDFPGVVLGMSGGIDSALAAAIAVDALGADKVWGVMLPSPYTSRGSAKDARASAKALSCKLDTISIKKAMKMFDATLSPVLGDHPQGTVAENIQSRCRGLILMALSNATGHMVLSTGNKSEMSVGYATLYGDMCGGFAVLKDVYKTQIYNIAHWRNKHMPETGLGPKGRVIPKNVLTKAPTAELRPDQTDQDSLPPYDILDGILECLIEQDMGMADIVAKGYDAAIVAHVWALLDRSEYKRRQSPPGVKISSRNLSRDRRYPITNKYKERATAR